MLFSFFRKSQSLFLLSFICLIAAGTLLLKLPWAYNTGVLSWVDSLFISTSAVCVTGLATVPTSNFTLFGQILILLLVQLGGIGIMSLSASILLMIGRGLSFSDTLMISNISENVSWRSTEGFTKTIIHYTLISEAVGFFVLLPGFMAEYPFYQAVWYSFFHSISAFCNAGFSPFDNSMVGQSSYVKLAIAFLIILGGLGVYVIYDLILIFQKRQTRLRVHSKLILSTTFILLVLGTLLLWISSNDGRHVPMGWIDAFFQSTTARTAGFNSVDLTTLSNESITLMIILMLIGASPGSTGGGMKTSTVALAFIAILNTFKGNPEILLYKRKIPFINVLRAFSVIVMFIILCCFGAIMIQTLSPACHDMMTAFFESASALATVGLTLGLTDDLTAPGKLFVVFLMYIGRVGPFTIMLFLMQREKKAHLSYPEERIIIG